MRQKLFLTFGGLTVGLTALSALLMIAGDQTPLSKSALTTQLAESDIPQFPITIREGRGTPRIATGTNDIHGQAVTVSCSTCHATTLPNRLTKRSEDLDEFHGGLRFSHGQLTCLSCHNSENYDSLRLADGQSLEFKNVQQLCAQCHGPQTRDYLNGSHGGMNGHWDLSRGPRTRNNCIDCHDAHSPAYQPMMPVFAPAPAARNGKNSH